METGAVVRTEDRQLTPDEIELLASLVIDEPDHYSVLGVERSSAASEINTAYCRAVDFFHPRNHTRLAESDNVLHWKLSCAYLRVVEAFSTLSSRARREAYDGTLNRQIIGSVRSRQRGQSAAGMANAAAKLGIGAESATPTGLPPSGHERRRVERAELRLPLVVVFDHNWQEITETIDVSPLGVKFLLARTIEPGTLVRMELPMPPGMRTKADDSVLYSVSGYVIQVAPGSTKRSVVAEFV